MDPRLLGALAGGPASGAQLRTQLGISQPTLSRLIDSARTEIAVLGRGRTTRYALYRSIRDLPPEVPVNRITALGDAQRIGTLVTIRPDRFWFEDLEKRRASAEFRSLPWFMTDMRPQGYLGRIFPRTHAELDLPDRVEDWNEDQVLYAIARRGEDTAGNLVVGEESLARWTGTRVADAPIAPENRLHRYGELADRTVAGYPPGSSAGGEQPKFTAVVTSPLRTAAESTRHLLVKFSGTPDTAAARRWADLLLAEHLAGLVLGEHGHAAARSEYLDDGRRAYLEVQRFDRIGTRGRLGLVSLGALDDEFVGERRGWSESAAALLRARVISADDARELRWLSAFGALIGNTDMHLGNASFLTEDRRTFRLAPSYDMLPMLFAPVRDEVPAREFTRPEPRPGQAEQWLSALEAAREYWRRLAEDERLSRDFRPLALTAAARIGEVVP